MHQSQVKMCFLRGPLRWLTEQIEKPKISLNFAKRKARYKEFGYRDFFGYSKLIFLFFVLYHFMLPGNFYYGSEIRHGIFWGINFGPAIFGGFVWSPRDFLGFWFLPPFDHPCHLKSTSSGLELSWKGLWIFHPFHPKLIYSFLTGNSVGESNEKTKPSYCHKMHLKLKLPGNFGGF